MEGGDMFEGLWAGGWLDFRTYLRKYAVLSGSMFGGIVRYAGGVFAYVDL
jgi:hypothetical protein